MLCFVDILAIIYMRCMRYERIVLIDISKLYMNTITININKD
jgi:hypothetical protein